MDAGILNFYKEQEFSPYFVEETKKHDRSIDIDATNSWSMDPHDLEQGIKEDLSSIPDINLVLPKSPSSKEDFHQIINEWNNFINLDVNNELGAQSASSEVDDLYINEDNFDITKYVEEHDIPVVQTRIKEEEDELIDVQTCSDDIDIKVDVVVKPLNAISKRTPKFGGKRIDKKGRRYLLDATSNEENDDEDTIIDVETIEPSNQPLLQAIDVDSLLQEFEATETTNTELRKVSQAVETKVAAKNIAEVDIKVDQLISPFKSPRGMESIMLSPKGHKLDLRNAKEDGEPQLQSKDVKKNKNKQIMQSLPSELIDRIRQSSKRKPVPVIDPILPPKRRTIVQNKIHHNTKRNPQQNENHRNVQLDHDYFIPTPMLNKDSGFSSCEEDEQILQMHTADRKSNLLKKKLNLDEYKKRLVTRIDRCLKGSDENARRLKHTEMLMKLASEHIAQQSSSESLPTLPLEIAVQEKDVELPANFEMKTLICNGMNTEESWLHLQHIAKLTRIRNIDNSSTLISCILEQLPKPVIADRISDSDETKTVAFIDTTRPKKEMREIGVQTDFSCAHLIRTVSSSSSSDSESSDSSDVDERMEKHETRAKRRQREERLKIVEERRVVYVGGFDDDFTKEDLHRRFSRFGPIAHVNVHFRERGENYGFVTFCNKQHAYDAVENGNCDPNDKEYNLSFGGRRLFCHTGYADLDDMQDEYFRSPMSEQVFIAEKESFECDDSFDNLLRKAKAKLRERML